MAKPARKPAAQTQTPTGRFGALAKFLKAATADADEDPDADNDADDEDGDDAAQPGDADDDGGDADDEDDQDGEEEDADAAPAAGTANPKHAQFRHGFHAANVRWAKVLTHKNSANRLEAAVTLLANPKLTASEITGMLANMAEDSKGGTSARQLLDRTPRHNLGTRAGSEGGDETDATASRKRAAKRVSKTATKPTRNRRRDRDQED